MMTEGTDRKISFEERLSDIKKRYSDRRNKLDAEHADAVFNLRREFGIEEDVLREGLEYPKEDKVDE